MATIDIFNNDAFSTTSLVAAIEKVPFLPQYLSDLEIFEDDPVRTESVWVEERDGQLTLIKTSKRGAPLPQRTTEKRTARGFKTTRIAKGDRLMAAELQGIRAFGSETELMAVQTEVARRLAGPTGLMREVQLTWENMRLGAVQGIVVDADSSPIINWFDEFGIAQPAEIGLDIAAIATGSLRKTLAKEIVRPMTRAAKGLLLPTSQIYALCGDDFFDDLTSHDDVRQTYLNWQAATELRTGTAFSAFRFGGISWINYRGTDDNSTVAVPVDDAKFFFRGAPGLFRQAWSPAEFFGFINTPGLPVYPKIVLDDDREAYVDIEVYSYPMFICTRPGTLFRARAGA